MTDLSKPEHLSEKIFSNPMHAPLEVSYAANRNNKLSGVEMEVESVKEEMAKMVAVLIKGSLYVPNVQKADKIFAKINKYYSLYQNDFESKLLVRFWNYLQLAYFTDQGNKIDILAIVNQFIKYALAHGKDEQVDRLTGEIDNVEAQKLLKDSEYAKTLILSFLVKIFRNIDGAETANNFGDQNEENDFFDRVQKISDLHGTISEILGSIPSSIIHKYMLTSISDNNSHFNNQFLFRFFL